MKKGKNFFAVMILTIPLIAGGCGAKITVNQIPGFYDGKLKTIAVMPFRNATQWRGAGDVISDSLASSLMANGTYKVYNRNDLKALLGERDLQDAMNNSPGQVQKIFEGGVGDVQAILVGTVTNYVRSSRSRTEYDPVMTWDAYRQQYVQTGTTPRQVITNEANITVTASLIRVSDGSQIYATPLPIQGKSWAEGSPPGRSAEQCLIDATNQVLFGLVEQFAIIRKEVTVPKDAFRTASGMYDGKWKYKDKFAATDTTGMIVLKLPPSCDRNKFRVTIIRKETETDLLSLDVTWGAGDSNLGYGMKFDPSEIMKAGGGPGIYVAKFYAGPAPSLMHEFKIGME